ncbi:MAG TPA: hypothetical protein DCL86_01550 [Bacteroidales bacterium]|nr:hypothetical protein [Bacteroidales bacterium]
MRGRWFFMFLVMALLTHSAVNGQQWEMPVMDSLCASAEEYKLFRLINDHRRIHNVAELPLSRSLSYVARVHAMDLTRYRPDFGDCNLHSWSENGQWTACCYATDIDRIKCMTEKPRQLTNYKFKAWEMAYEAGEPARAIDALDLWVSIGITNDYLLNTGKWTKPWKAMGIAIYGEYALVWFGEAPDPEPSYYGCDVPGLNLAKLDATGQPETTTPPAAGAELKMYHVITGSLNSLEKANREVIRLRTMGYNDARFLISGSHFRISLKTFKTEAEAQNEINAIQTQFPGAWVLKPDQP